MSASYYIYAFTPPDKKWKEMKAVYDACIKAKVDIPQEVSKFFDWDVPSDKGVQTRLKINEECENGRVFWDVPIDTLPKDAKFVRFVISY